MNDIEILDSPPIRLIKILCRQFGETIQHIFCDKVISSFMLKVLTKKKDLKLI